MKVALQAVRADPRDPGRPHRPQADFDFVWTKIDDEEPPKGTDAAGAVGQDPRRGGAPGPDLPAPRARSSTATARSAGTTSPAPGRARSSPTRTTSASAARSRARRASRARPRRRRSRAPAAGRAGRPAGPEARTQRRSTGAPALSSASASRSSRIGSSGLWSSSPVITASGSSSRTASSSSSVSPSSSWRCAACELRTAGSVAYVTPDANPCRECPANRQNGPALRDPVAASPAAVSAGERQRRASREARTERSATSTQQGRGFRLRRAAYDRRAYAASTQHGFGPHGPGHLCCR